MIISDWIIIIILRLGTMDIIPIYDQNGHLNRDMIWLVVHSGTPAPLKNMKANWDSYI